MKELSTRMSNSHIFSGLENNGIEMATQDTFLLMQVFILAIANTLTLTNSHIVI